ncbi:NUDIX hydrolase [Phormidium sp. FACHB-592]|uniref:NUDIX hydrolase n=1 Tax=Stenomitos frigidus AS-A4 TaxID=2933935 RepID=A0ABV0KCR4_9CYAN|nr:NUDIX hydrolase [Phormidium sp. FACHB-592]MBD2077504.1 NUDIX hydrolase [Phormidium sp. FACHB-592]
MRKRMLILRQSGVLPYRMTAGKAEVLLVTSTRRKRWIVPKGWIALGLSAADSAAKEALEEAGVSGHVVTPAIETYVDRKWGYPCEMELFLMRVETVLDDWSEAKQRKRQWLSLSEAAKRVKSKTLKHLLIRLEAQPALLDQH